MAAATDQTAPGTTDALEDALDLDLDAGIDDELFEGYDPLEDNEFAGDEDVDYPVGDGSNLKSVPGPSVKPVAEHDERPASERTAELFSHMAARRKTLIAILRACREKQPVRDVADLIDDLKRRDRCVYSANDLCTLLERAGAIERVGEDGESYEEVELEPKTVVVDGMEYLEPQTPPPAFWVATQAGLDVLAQDDPEGRTERLFEEDGDYLPIYKRILTLCSEEGGASAKAIAKACDQDPLLQKPRYYSSRFVERLNKSDALAWSGKTWEVTETGREALAQLDGVRDDGASYGGTGGGRAGTDGAAGNNGNSGNEAN